MMANKELVETVLELSAEGPSPAANAATSPEKEKQEVRMVTVLYSQGRDLYRVPSIDKPCWLSVKAYPLPAAELAVDAIYLGPSMTADGNRWRKAYDTAWRAVLPGDKTTIPANDPLILDFAAFCPSPALSRERAR